MFTSNVLEATQEEIILRGMEEEALHILVNYCYTGWWLINIYKSILIRIYIVISRNHVLEIFKFSNPIYEFYLNSGSLELREDNVEKVLSTAHQLLLNEVVQVCCDFLTKQLHPANCLGIQYFADLQGCLDLHKLAIDYTAVSYIILYLIY